MKKYQRKDLKNLAALLSAYAEAEDWPQVNKLTTQIAVTLAAYEGEKDNDPSIS